MTTEFTAVILDANAPLASHVGAEGDHGRVTAYLEVDDFRILLGRALSNEDKALFLTRLADAALELSASLPVDVPVPAGPAITGSAR
jgi:hypothetical protein